MYLSTLDSLVGFLWWVLSESLVLQYRGFFFVLPSVGRSMAFLPVVVPDTPFPLTPLYRPSVALWRGYFFCCSKTFL